MSKILKQLPAVIFITLLAVHQCAFAKNKSPSSTAAFNTITSPMDKSTNATSTIQKVKISKNKNDKDQFRGAKSLVLTLNNDKSFSDSISKQDKKHFSHGNKIAINNKENKITNNTSNNEKDKAITIEQSCNYYLDQVKNAKNNTRDRL